jgi:predicted phosphohydrolase
MRIVCLSDTHELHGELIVPPGDLLLHAGDFTFFSKRPSMIDDFNRWLGELPHRHRVVIFGNHEFAFATDPGLRARLSNAIVLMNEAAKIDGVTIWGSPVTPMKGGAFGLSRAEDRARLYSRIPPDTKILLTHTPPSGVLDGAPHAGCPELRAAVIRLRPRLHVFGHIHAGYGTMATRHTMFVNAALFGEHGDLERHPIVVDLK